MAARARSAGEARELSPLGRPLRPLRDADSAARDAPVVVLHGGAGEARARGDRVGACALPSRGAWARRGGLAARDPAVERVAPALVGAAAAGLVLPEWTCERR